MLVEGYLGGKRLIINPAKLIGKGGEAEVFDIGNGRAAKLYKPPSHPDYALFPNEQRGAAERIAEQQRKLRAFPSGLGPRVIAPEELIFDRPRKMIIGYVMRLVARAECMLQYARPEFRKKLDPAVIGSLFRDLHKTVQALHGARVVIGDFNDVNVLVSGREAYLIDADSFQFGSFLSRVFTTKFVDPLVSHPSKAPLELMRPYTPLSDWYAYAVMLAEVLLATDPYGGIYKPKNPAKRVVHDARPLHRMTVFHPDVVYPKPAIPFRVLPDDLLHQFHLVFEKDWRGVFPVKLLETLRWTKCAHCGAEHARPVCPFCAHAAPAAIKQTVVVHGTVKATTLFRTRGTILCASLEHGKLRWLYHENGTFKREQGEEVGRGLLDPFLRFRIQGNTTLIGHNNTITVFRPGTPAERFAADTYGTAPVFDATQEHIFWLENGRLLRRGVWGPEHVGDVLSGQTLFWAGNTLGIGFYRAGGFGVTFVFDSRSRGINDGVPLKLPTAQIVDATAVFSETYAWLLISSKEQSMVVNRVWMVDRYGNVQGEATARQGDGSWLASVRGLCAAGAMLFAPTDEGIVRVEADRGALVLRKTFPETAAFVGQGDSLFAGKEGLYVVGEKDIQLLKIS